MPPPPKVQMTIEQFGRVGEMQRDRRLIRGAREAQPLPSARERVASTPVSRPLGWLPPWNLSPWGVPDPRASPGHEWSTAASRSRTAT